MGAFLAGALGDWVEGEEGAGGGAEASGDVGRGMASPVMGCADTTVISGRLLHKRNFS